MTERTPVRRELVKQTALLFFVFALLFALLGAGIYSMVSSSIYRTADEKLLSLQAETNLDLAEIERDDAEAALASSAVAVDPAYSIQQDIVDYDPQFITLLRDERGTLVDTVGLYASYPDFLSDIPFDKNNLARIYQTSAGGYEYRGITYAMEENGVPSYMQVLVNVDAELAILDNFTRALVAYLTAAVVVSAAASYLLSRRTLRPIVANWKAQTEFVQNASHELRTPLAVIQTTSELLLDHPESRVVDRFEDVNTISEESKRLSRLVNALMELSVGDAGHARLDTAAVQVDELVKDAASGYEDFIEAQGKRLAVETACPGTIEADADKLRQLLGIALDNAVKYTSAGDDIVVSTEAKGARCVIAVADTGCGISPEDRAHAFERFYRADKARSRETGGHGLGLSLAKGIVEAHGGAIALQDNHPRGTAVVITLPR